MNTKNPFGFPGAKKESSQFAEQDQESSTHGGSNSEPSDTMPPFTPGAHVPGGIFSGDDLFTEENMPDTSFASASDEQQGSPPHNAMDVIAALKKEVEEVKLRALADLDNARKRLDREREEMIRYSTEKVLNDIIPALDNLDLALQHAPTEGPSKGFVDGVQMTKKLMIDALKRHGLEEVGEAGQEFDPTLHEAVGTTNTPEIPSNHVSALLSKGYSLNGRLLRPAKVMVSKH